VSEPTEAPDWAFSPDQAISCPDCGVVLSGLNWRLDEDDHLTHMVLIPCSHELSTEVWELAFHGRDRRLGTVIRTPKFQRKDGSS
jgi:hypothetical protein